MRSTGYAVCSAFWKRKNIVADEDAFFRVIGRHGAMTVLTASASLAAFENAAPVLSSSMLEAASTYASGQSPGSTISTSDILTRMSDVVAGWPKADPEAEPQGWGLAAFIAQGAINATWAGGDTLVLMRGRTAILQTTAHRHPMGVLTRSSTTVRPAV